ncbi:MarR family winged helix-turn-helix transcriptional regulator [Trinickia acidisoli]|uniref:MarR family winged helix-turn-helix transcriptional regulator n=1 Tax=Trinickia acidisoli TaxID=2767482 RepID=UPI001F5C1097|nr:MarR family transcriptional regulator [Trinickia acidisoli]
MLPPSEDDASAQTDQSELLELVGYNIRRAYLIIQTWFDREMDKHDLRQAEFAVLSVLRGNPGINQRALADALAVAPPNLATLLDRLEGRGLLTRQRSTEDKRVQHVELTTQGVRLYGRALKAAAVADDTALEKLSRAEREQLKTLLRKIFVE